MRIQHNIMAMSAYRNYTNNVSAMKKNLEKLSSGYKINRAGDDAAGLAISEKMRAQITGLETAQKNAKDGISLVQTAEGALTEVHDMLNRMVELASQSANGTYDDTLDRKQMESELNQLRAEINRIADSSNFNGINLLDGSMDTSAVKGATYEALSADDIKKLFVNTDDTGKVEDDVGTTGNTTGTTGGKTVLETEGGAKSTAGFQISLDGTKAYLKTGEAFSLKIGDNDALVSSTNTAEKAKTMTSTELAKDLAAQNETVTVDGHEYSVKADGNVLIFTTKDTEDFTLEQSQAVSWTVGVPETNEEPMAITDPTDPDYAFTDGVANTSNATIAFDLAGFDVDKAGTVTFSICGKDYDVEITEDEVAAKDTTSLDQVVANKLKTAMDADPLTDTGAGDFTATISNNTQFTLTSANQAAATDTTNFANGTLSVAEKTAPAAGALTDITATNFTDGAASQNATAKIDLSGVAAQVETAGTLTFTIGDKEYEVEVTEEMLAADDADEQIAAALVTELNDDALTDDAAGEFTAATVNGAETQIVLTSANQAAMTTTSLKDVLNGGTVGVTFTAGSDDPLSSSGTINPGLQKVTDNNSGASAQLANTVVNFDTVDAWQDGAKIKIGDTTYTVALGADSKFAGANNVIDLTDKEAGATDLKKIAAERLTVAAKDNSIFTVGHDGLGNTTLQQRSSVKESTDMSTMDKLASYLGVSTANPDSLVNAKAGSGLTLQIGDTADSFNQLKVEIKDCHTTAMGLDGISVANQEDAATALDAIKAAINYVSDVRGTLGATQNRLDHTINNLSVMTENIQDAESTIRDVDIAEEMMAYTKNNILIQSAQAMLAQANQVPQGVLQLLG